ncbi:LacI family transcriptional regulator [Saccharomonospora sp. CUA-673]|uniref:sugar ABC transporter substrate-binding protein n=1 Tax=Saccharomonospora sp. CUA-673 TaxID=1904969 RepID=UPI00095CCDF7|nr:substrate-binding domain-containing protein [Saccharomonospora sp. CUA-673]OLT45919.1 LacI family transcriptional regulator [Saccharomonospora sp. CUA-673]
MRKLLALGVTLTLTVAAGCGVEVRQPTGAAEPGDALRLAVVPKAIGFDFWEQVRIGAECAASKHREVTMHWDGVTSEDDVSGQQSLLQDFLAQGVDGLVYAATDAQALSNVSNTAVDQGTTVVNIDSGTTPQPKEVPVYATDNVQAAERGTDLLAEQLGGRGTVAFVEFQPGTSTNDTRGEGFERGLAKHQGLRLVARQSSDSDYNKALQVTQDILTANPNLDGIYAGNEPSMLGAAEAVRQAGKAGDIKIVGWDTAEGQVDALREGVVTGLIAQNPFAMGYKGVQAAVETIRHGTSDRSTDTGATIITKDNVDDPEVRTLLNPSCANPPR